MVTTSVGNAFWLVMLDIEKMDLHVDGVQLETSVRLDNNIIVN